MDRLLFLYTWMLMLSCATHYCTLLIGQLISALLLVGRIVLVFLLIHDKLKKQQQQKKQHIVM